MSNYWLSTIKKENLRVVYKNLIWGSKPYYESSLREISIDDNVIFYVKGGYLGGIYSINSKITRNDSRLFQEDNIKFTVDLKPKVTPEKVDQGYLPEFDKDLISNLKFIDKKSQWGMYMQNFARELSFEDYNLIKNHIEQNI